MNEEKHPLLRAAEIASGHRRLGELTGLSRLAVESHHLSAGDTLDLPAGGEQFLYVLAGTGTLTTTAGENVIGSGDFAGLEASESAAVGTRHALTLLTGRLSSS